MTLLSIEQPPYVTLGTKTEYVSSVFRLVPTCPFRAQAGNRVGFRKSGLCPLPDRPRHRGYFHKAPTDQCACQFHSIEAKCAFPRLCGYMPGRSGPVRQVLAAMEVHGGYMWATPAATGIGGPLWGCFFNETACRFRLMEAKCVFPR